MKLLLCLFICIMLFGCETGKNDKDKIVVDQCLRQQLFKECMECLPAGPQSTKYNDWAEVVNECRTTAYYHSMRKASQVKPECRADY